MKFVKNNTGVFAKLDDWKQCYLNKVAYFSYFPSLSLCLCLSLYPFVPVSLSDTHTHTRTHARSHRLTVIFI